MKNILINAYAISPNWGSEPGMGWNWVINIAKYCNVFVITEGEWRDEIEAAIEKLPQKDNLHFYYNPLPDKVRRMCWNQGDWRFYWYYRKWQKKTLQIAREIVAKHPIDVIHQLNMIGFREPGYLWKIKGPKYVWGPVGGMELMPMSYLRDVSFKHKLFNGLKNYINRLQYTYSPRVKQAINRSSHLIAAVKGVQDVLGVVHNRESVLINETGVTEHGSTPPRPERNDGKMRILWIGKFDFRKQLPLAIKSIAKTKIEDIELHICGTGSPETVEAMKALAEAEGVARQCFWHGRVDHSAVERIMNESDLLLFTSIMDATSTVVMEAISVGLPILSFNTCGFGPIVKEFAGVTIEISNPEKSVNDFAAEIKRLYANPNLLTEISENIRQNRQNLTWDAKAKRMISIYNRLVDKMEP